MTFDDFIAKYDGKFVDIDAMYGAQCKDLFSAYNTKVVGCPFYIYGNANQLFDAAPDEYYEKLTANPQKGDVVIWNIGDYGHVAIFVSQLSADTFQSFDQNFPIGSPCHVQGHTYKNIIGYLRPKGVSMDYKQIDESFYKMHLRAWQLLTDQSDDPSKQAVMDYNYGIIAQGSTDVFANDIESILKNPAVVWIRKDKIPKCAPCPPPPACVCAPCPDKLSRWEHFLKAIFG